MNRLRLPIVVLFACAASRADAQRTLRSVGDDFRNAAGDMVHIWTSPFHAAPSDWVGAAATIGAAILTLPIDDDVDRWIVSNPRAPMLRLVNPLRENRRFDLVDFGTGKLIQPLSGIAYVIGVATDSRGLRDAALGCSGMQFSNSAIRKQVLYRLVARPRPDSAVAKGLDQYDVSVPGRGWGYHSFPAGHFMNAIGCASYFASRFHLGVAEPVMYAVAFGIGAGRLADRRHWTSDSVIGLVMGYSIGRTIANRQLSRLGRAPTPSGASLGAAQGEAGTRYTVSWALQF